MNVKKSADHYHAKILVVDDQEANVKLLTYLLQGEGYTAVHSTMNPREVFDLYQSERYDLILLDLNMPIMNGFEVMEMLQCIESEGYLPVLVITAEPAHKIRALQSGAMDFISKPIDHLEVLTRVHNMLEVRLLQKQLHQANEILEQRVEERTAALEESYCETVLTMTRAAEFKDPETGMHIQRIGYYCYELAKELGMEPQFCHEILNASPMHDIGKIAIPDRILLKPGGFSCDEWDIMKTHALLGADILAQKKSPYLRMGAEIAQHHHEKWNGDGYPNGLRGEEIPLSARIMNICDIYDALRSKRPYKCALAHEEVLDIMRKGDGRTRPEHFDPEILDTFMHKHVQFCEIFEANAE